MSRLHLNKKGLRVFGIAESFRQGAEKSILAGVVMRGGLVVDGLIFGSADVGGDDATAGIARLYRRLKRNDVNLVMLAGCILSMYNIVDLDGLHERLKVPVLCVTFKETSGIENAIARRFPGSSAHKLEAYRKLGGREPVALTSGHTVYLRRSGLSQAEARSVCELFTLQGAVPEPLRLAKLLARAGRERAARGSAGRP